MVRGVVDVNESATRSYRKESSVLGEFHVRDPRLGVADLRSVPCILFRRGESDSFRSVCDPTRSVGTGGVRFTPMSSHVMCNF